MDEPASNKPLDGLANDYYRAYHFLLTQLPDGVRAKVLEAKDSDREPPKEVRDFCKRVIDMAEHGS